MTTGAFVELLGIWAQCTVLILLYLPWLLVLVVLALLAWIGSIGSTVRAYFGTRFPSRPLGARWSGVTFGGPINDPEPSEYEDSPSSESS
jgi:hypothetical protein